VARPGDDGVAGEVLEEVLVAARADAPWAFERLYSRFGPMVAGYLRMHGAADPEGLTNEVMLGVFRGLPSFEGDIAGFRSWLFTIAHRRLIDDRRRASVRPQTDELHHDRHETTGGDVELEAESQLERDRVHALLEGLTHEQREVVLLRVVADLSIEEVARILGKRPGAVKMLQRRGLASLRRRLEAEGVTS
jgi:RNA polymerase sigma factor (sigma-70 family)